MDLSTERKVNRMEDDDLRRFYGIKMQMQILELKALSSESNEKGLL